MKHSPSYLHPLRRLFLVGLILLGASALLSSCASDDNPTPQKKHRHHRSSDTDNP